MEMNHSLSDDNAKRVIADQLRKYVGRGCFITWADLAERTQDDERKLRSYVDRDPAAMPAPVMMRVFAQLPAPAWAAVCGAMGFCAPPRIDDEDAACMRRALAQASQLVADGNEFLADGIIDPSERAQFSDRAEDLIPTLRAHIIKRE